MKNYKVTSAGWYADVKVPNNTNEPSYFRASEAATKAVNRFFLGGVRLNDLEKPFTIEPIIRVRSKDEDYLFYAPKILANAGWHDEASSLHEKINMLNCKPKV